MNKLDYLDSIEWQSHFALLRKMRSTLLIINQELKSKKTISQNEKLAFQEAILDHLKKFKRSFYRWNIVVSIKFSTTERNTPDLQTLAKNYIDLMWKNLTADTRKYLLFKDDRQIKFLTVSKYSEKDESCWRITIKVSGMSDFELDMDLLNKITSSDFSNAEKHSRYNSILERDEYPKNPILDIDSSVTYLKLFKERKDEYIEKYWEDRYKMMYNHYLGEIQEMYLNNHFNLKDLLLFFTDRRAKRFNNKYEKLWIQSSLMDYNEITSMHIDTWNFILKNLSINWWKLPSKEGDGSILIQQLNLELDKLLGKRPILKNLVLPLRVTVIITQRGILGANKDLDNVMRDYILKAINIKLKPSIISNYTIIDLSNINTLDKWDIKIFLSKWDWFSDILYDLEKEINDRRDYHR